ncbi:hypothetical protein SAY86_014929 [Trapa natans]|uniref:Protein kinase domain-containing protein n=1 Tax=Trapa natans TaxID=22666 RepID=A0AAN7QGR8_TRANT|nr:hypothetical protein SAY86_014929 [Trapa natans]
MGLFLLVRVRPWGAGDSLILFGFLDPLHEKQMSRAIGGWDRFKVSLGTAEGLAYLHHECLEWVIHCDVKPEKVLLDSDLEPKIADFGLAKLLQRGNNVNSDFSKIWSTKGYMAPERSLNLPITAKVDVFSYLVMVLEMVRGSSMVSSWANNEST